MSQNVHRKYLGKRNKKKGKGGASRPRPRFWSAGRSRPSPRARLPSSANPHPCPRTTAGRAVPPWRTGKALPPRGAHAPGWTRRGRPPGAPGRTRFSLLCHSRSSTPPLSLSFAQIAAVAAPPIAIAADAWSSSLWQLQPPPSNPRPPATLPRLPTPRVCAQPPSISLARPLELAGVSRSSGDLSAHVVLPLLSPIAHDFKRISSASNSCTFPRPWFALYRTEMAGPR